jgi:c-di-GMP phosphodiesterase
MAEMVLMHPSIGARGALLECRLQRNGRAADTECTMQIMLARQPVFDPLGRIAAYEILSHGDASAPEHTGGLLVNALIGVGLPQLSDNLPVYLPITPSLISDDALRALNTRGIFLQIDARNVTEADIATLHRVCGSNPKVVVDNWTAGDEALLEIASVVKIDAATADIDASRAWLPDPARRIGLLAKGVSEPALVEACTAMGFTLFQGSFFSEPTLIDRRDLNVEQVRLFKLMRQVSDLSVSDADLEEAFHRDATLTYKLLRIVNSAMTGGVAVHSITHAIRIMGRDALYRWLALLLLSSTSRGALSDPRLQQALLRGRTCELLATHLPQRPPPGPLFLVGLSSALLPVLGLNADEMSSYLGLAEPIRAALRGDPGTLGATLAMVSDYERGAWPGARTRAASLHVDVGVVAASYVQALLWLSEVRNAA